MSVVSPLIYNIVDYGAVSNGGDCSGAFQAAFDALNNTPEGGQIYIPPGRFLIQNPIGGTTDKSCVIKGAGADASVLVFNGPNLNNGLVLQQVTPNNACAFKDFGVVATGCPNLGNGSVLSIIGVLQGCNGITVDGLHVRLTDDAPCSNVLYVRNPSSGVIRDFNVDGYSGWGEGNTATGIYIICDTQGANAIQLYNCNIFRVYKGIWCVGGQIQQYVMEGFEANECTLVGVQYGLHMQGGWYRPPGNAWKGGHINARQICILLETWYEFKISDTLLYLDGSAAANSQGHIRVINCDEIQIHNNSTRYVDEITGGPTQRGIWGIAISDSSNVLVQGNFFDIGRADSAALYSVSGNSNVRSAFNTKRGGGAYGAGAYTEIGQDIVV